MTDHSITAHGSTGPIPADDANRYLVIARPDDPEARHIFQAGNSYTILVSGSDTNGRYCLIDMLVPDGGGPPPHRHDFEEAFILLDGELQFTFRGETRIVRAPATVNIPANAPHQFKNVSGQTVHMLCQCTPAGQEQFFAAVGTPIDSRGAPPPKLSEDDMAAKMTLAKKLAPKYRTEFLEKA